MFLFGILSSPLPYLLMAAFYFFGFAMGMFHKETAKEEIIARTEVKHLHVDSPSKTMNKTDNSFYFHQYKVEKKVVGCSLKLLKTPPPGKEKLIYFVHDIKIPPTSLTDFYYCRPPPVNS